MQLGHIASIAVRYVRNRHSALNSFLNQKQRVFLVDPTGAGGFFRQFLQRTCNQELARLDYLSCTKTHVIIQSGYVMCTYR